MNALSKIEDDALPIAMAQQSPMLMIQQAIAGGASIEMIERLMAMQDRMQANEAKKAFSLAMAAAKTEIKPILKDKVVDFTGKNGQTTYAHEDLASIAEHVDPILARHGLSYHYRSAQEGTSIAITCVVEHRDGHSRETTLSGFKDDSGNKNAIQAIGSAATYLQRYTLKLALGLSAAKDTDGVSSPQEGPKSIDAEQFRWLQEYIEKADASEEKMLDFCKKPELKDFTQKDFQWAKTMLLKRIADGKGKQPEGEQ